MNTTIDQLDLDTVFEDAREELRVEGASDPLEAQPFFAHLGRVLDIPWSDMVTVFSLFVDHESNNH